MFLSHVEKSSGLEIDDFNLLEIYYKQFTSAEIARESQSFIQNCSLMNKRIPKKLRNVYLVRNSEDCKMEYNADDRIFNILCQLHELYSGGSEVTVDVMRTTLTGAPL